jgi:hypothetical protein
MPLSHPRYVTPMHVWVVYDGLGGNRLALLGEHPAIPLRADDERVLGVGHREFDARGPTIEDASAMAKHLEDPRYNWREAVGADGRL